MMFPQKRFITFPLNILYAGVLLFCVDMFYTLLNMTLGSASGGSLTVGVGPILFGVFTTAWDILLIRIKHTAQSVLSDARRASKPSLARYMWIRLEIL